MANALVVFAPRSGSTIISDLLAHKYKGVNLDELLQGGIRETLKDKIPPDIKRLLQINKIYERRLKQSQNTNLPRPQICWQEYSIYQTCFGLVKDCVKRYPTVVKWYPNAYPGKDFIEWAIDNNFEIYFTNRRNFEEQLYSYCFALHKQTYFKKTGNSKIDYEKAFMNTNNTEHLEFVPSEMPHPRALDVLMLIHSIQMCWYAITKMYGHYGKIIYYEDHIAKEDFHEIGVDNETYLDYKKQNSYIKPTERYKIGEGILNWPDIIKVAKKNFEMPYV